MDNKQEHYHSIGSSRDHWIWKDCDLKGHEEGCYMTVCPDCGAKDRDCEY